MADPITLQSGANLTIQIAPFKLGTELVRTVARELIKVRVSLDVSDLTKVAGGDLNTVKDAAFQLIQSDALEKILHECMARCLYNGERITADTWEKVEAREDYFPVMWEVFQANMRPFKRLLGLLLSDGAKAAPDNPR